MALEIDLNKKKIEEQYECIGTKKLTVRGNPQTYNIYQIPLSDVHYNRLNGRIASEMSSIKKSNKLDEVSDDDIENFIFESAKPNNKKTQESIRKRGQDEVAIVLRNGTVIDGNRRFTCLRRLFRDSHNERFRYLNAVILDDTVLDDRTIKLLELNIQYKEEKVGYTPINRLAEISENILSDHSIITREDMLEATDESAKDLDKEIQYAKLMLEFLDFVGKPFDYKYAEENKIEGSLQEMGNNLVNQKGLSDEEMQTIKEICFSLIINGVRSQSLRPYIYAFRNKNILSEEKIDRANDLNDTIKSSVMEEGRIPDDVVSTFEEFTEDTVSEHERLEERESEIKVAKQALKKAQMIDPEKLEYLKEEEQQKVIEYVDKLKKTVDNLWEKINVKR